jgi:hypothetical protein
VIKGSKIQGNGLELPKFHGSSRKRPIMTAEFYILLMEKISLRTVKCLENIFRKLDAPSCMEEDNMPTAL